MLTQEQQEVVDTVCSSIAKDKIIAVNSIAGSGKTSTGNAVIRAYKPKNGFYTAFNKAIVSDSSKRFGDLLDCRTVHSLAYQYIKPSGDIIDMNYLTITEDIDYKDKQTIINTLDDFFRSDSIDIEKYLSINLNDEYLRILVEKYANKMLNREIPPTFNYMLKCLHLMLANKEIDINYDLMILDECQDTTAVTLEIFKLINADTKVIFGDKYQNIYSFMNTVNAFEILENTYPLRLTKSFRCNPNIAQIVENFGKLYLEEDFKYKGNEEVEPLKERNTAYLSRNNSTLITRMNDLLTFNTNFTLIRNINDIFSMPMALLNAALGKPVYDKKYKYLEKEYKAYSALGVDNPYRTFFNYLDQTVKNDALSATIRMLSQFNKKHINIYDLKKKVSEMKQDKSITLTTAHAFKGLERDYVFIEDDLNNSVNSAIERLNDISLQTKDVLSLEEKRSFLTSDDKENLNTYYVALSRARTGISNVNYMR